MKKFFIISLFIVLFIIGALISFKVLKNKDIYQKLDFVVDNLNHNDKEKYLNVVWNKLLKENDINSGFTDEQIRYNYGFSKEELLIKLVDLNDDGIKDIIYSGQGSYFCGTQGCGLNILLSLGSIYIDIPFELIFFPKQYPVYVLNSKSNNLRNFEVFIEKGKKTICKFNGEMYKCDINKEQSKESLSETQRLKNSNFYAKN